MKSQNYTLLFLTILIFTASCSKEKIVYSTVQTGEVVKLDNNSVLFTGVVTNIADSITEYGFKWELQIFAGETPRNYIISYSGSPADDYFESKISSSMLPGREYFVRAFARTSTGISYGKDVEFVGGQNDPPMILDIKPDSVLLYDTIIIIGKNLGYSKNDLVVTAGSFKLSVLRANPDTIFARIPVEYNKASSNVSVEILSNFYDISDKMIILKPFSITSISPVTAQPNSYVTIYVKNFRPYFNPSVYLSGTGISMPKSGMTNNYIYCKVPNSIGSYFIDINIGGNLKSSPGKLIIAP
jgi:hypothetical protein